MSNENFNFLMFIAGVFIGNWLIVPIFFHRTRKNGFFIGIIAVAILSVSFFIIKLVHWLIVHWLIG